MPCFVLVIWSTRTRISLEWRHNGRDSVSNHQPRDCLLNRLSRRTSKKTSKLRVTGLCARNSPGPVNSPHKGPVTRKMFSFDDVTMLKKYLQIRHTSYIHVSFTTAPDFYGSFLPNKATFAKHCLIQLISKLPGSFDIHWVRQYLVNFTIWRAK